MRDSAVESVAVGFFDGVHLGHREILRRAGRVITFRNHPLSVLAPERAPRLVMTPEAKVAAIRECGVGDVEIEDFTPALASLPPEEFAARRLCGADGRRLAIVCGENWRFGAGGRGDAAFLRSIGFVVEVVPSAVLDGERVSSSRIRRCLAEGDVEKAGAMMGRAFSLRGTRFAGKGVGAEIGFPTVNLRPEIPPPMRLGVYVAEVGGVRALANCGVAPTMGTRAWTEPVVELHFLGSPPDGDVMDVGFLRFLREERAFSSLDDLKAQISVDLSAAARG